jgi:hypothetical protein
MKLVELVTNCGLLEGHAIFSLIDPHHPAQKMTLIEVLHDVTDCDVLQSRCVGVRPPHQT